MSLKVAWFQILTVLAEGVAHGADIQRRGRVVVDRPLYPAVLYGALEDLVARGWIEEVDEDTGRPPDENSRRRYYRITPEGRDAVSEEARRLQGLVDVARRALAADG